MLHAVAELAEDALRQVERVLRHEVHADALGTDEPHHLLDLLEQRFGRFVEEQVRFIKKEDQLGLLGIAHLGQVFEQLREQPQQEGRVELR